MRPRWPLDGQKNLPCVAHGYALDGNHGIGIPRDSRDMVVPGCGERGDVSGGPMRLDSPQGWVCPQMVYPTPIQIGQLKHVKRKINGIHGILLNFRINTSKKGLQSGLL